jgi:hypothetical protein
LGSTHITGTIKAQRQLDGKFWARASGIVLEYRRFPGIDEQLRMYRSASYRRDPETQAERDQRHRADAAKPQRREPQQAFCERSLIWLKRRQW